MRLLVVVDFVGEFINGMMIVFDMVLKLVKFFCLVKKFCLVKYFVNVLKFVVLVVFVGVGVLGLCWGILLGVGDGVFVRFVLVNLLLLYMCDLVIWLYVFVGLENWNGLLLVY